MILEIDLEVKVDICSSWERAWDKAGVDDKNYGEQPNRDYSGKIQLDD